MGSPGGLAGGTRESIKAMCKQASARPAGQAVALEPGGGGLGALFAVFLSRNALPATPVKECVAWTAHERSHTVIPSNTQPQLGRTACVAKVAGRVPTPGTWTQSG